MVAANIDTTPETTINADGLGPRLQTFLTRSLAFQ